MGQPNRAHRSVVAVPEVTWEVVLIPAQCRTLEQDFLDGQKEVRITLADIRTSIPSQRMSLSGVKNELSEVFFASEHGKHVS